LSSPDRPGSPFLPGKRGAIRSHWASFNNVRLKAGPHFSSLESDLRHFENLSRPTRVNRSHQTQMSTGPRAWSRKVGTGFRKRSCSDNKLERDDDSKKSHHALVTWTIMKSGCQD
jgi:hypothetical protein